MRMPGSGDVKRSPPTAERRVPLICWSQLIGTAATPWGRERRTRHSVPGCGLAGTAIASAGRPRPDRYRAPLPGVPNNVGSAAGSAHAIAGSAVANCRLHPRRTIFEAAEAVYRSVREIHIKLGIVK